MWGIEFLQNASDVSYCESANAVRMQFRLVVGIGYVPAGALAHLCTWLSGLFAQAMRSMFTQVVHLERWRHCDRQAVFSCLQKQHLDVKLL